MKKKPIDPVRQQQKNQGYRIGWVIGLLGIIAGFVWLSIKNG